MSRAVFKKWLLVSLVGVAAAFVSGCNTVSGVGKDLQKGGEAIERAAD
jgi:predicted small secreted protein